MEIAELQRLIGYDSDTGRLYWREPPHPRFTKGGTVGSPALDGHIKVELSGRTYKGHRLIWMLVTGQPIPNGCVIDHKNRDRSDNRLSNLRPATRSQNGANSIPRHDLPKGVYEHKRNGCVVGYRAFISESAKKKRYLGLFDNPQEAASAYQVAATSKFGQFARFTA